MNDSHEGREVTILMIEDDAGHARLIERNIRRAGVANRIEHVTDGTTAMARLFGDSDLTAPLLILLDLNLPDMSGVAILERLKADPSRKPIPIIVLTTTDDSQEIARCYALGASVYITKPVDYDAFANAIRQLGLFLSVIRLPEGSL
ncbi:response regulator [Sandaracinobacteroides saxicola]|uniref:Response regulator n=1 Tax=Sandaracinobacteroides saxicola TaxID=2759707 RepID=A0A7G5IJD2_9SPHN|nr:response regulator [Sandaracinobacteroides saxicola]QMW23474.1 response regulator [Sandaracinobacteroides saxicola]